MENRGYQVRESIRELQRLKNSLIFPVWAMVVASLWSSLWKVFFEGKSWESLQSDPSVLLFGITALVGIFLQAVTNVIVDGMIVLAKIEERRANLEDEQAAIERRARGDFTLAEIGAQQRERERQ